MCSTEDACQGYGFHPLTAWCTNIGDSLAVQLRLGNPGSFTASDHRAVLDAAIAQIPAEWRTDVLVTIDSAGASHEIIDHLTRLNIAVAQGKRGRRVEYSIGWSVFERTLTAIGVLSERDWVGEARHTDGAVASCAHVAELTGLLRAPGHDRLATWHAASIHASRHDLSGWAYDPAFRRCAKGAHRGVPSCR